MLTNSSKSVVFYALPALILLTLGTVIGRVSAPAQTQPEQIPFGMSQEVAYRYRHCPDTITAYVIEGTNHAVKPGHVFLEDTWPNFGALVSEEDLGTAINEQSKIIKLTIQKNACWK